MDIKWFSKKELKDYVNTNGFFFHMQCNTLEPKMVNEMLQDTTIDMIKTWVEIPTWEDVIVYQWIASQNYWVWEKSRNGYKYDQKGWDFTDYNYNPLVLFQHDTNQPIGNTISFWYDQAWNLNIMFFIYKDTLDWVDKVRVEKGLIRALSTWALTDEYMFEETETGNLITEEDAEEKYGWGNLIDAYMWISEFLILVITKARMLENSLVTMWSNEQALAIQNGIWQYFKNKAELLKEKLWDKINERKNSLEWEVEWEDEWEKEWEDETDVAEVEVTETQETIEEVANDNLEAVDETTEIEEVTEDEKQEEWEIVESEEVIETEETSEEIVEEVQEEIEEEVEVEEVEEETETEKDEETQEEIKIPEVIENQIVNQNILNNEFAWKIEIDKVLQDFEIQIDNKINSIKDELNEMTKGYVSVETYTNDIESLKDSFKNDIETLNKELNSKIDSLWKDSEEIVDTINELVLKLRNTVFNSAWSYQVNKKPTSELAKKLEIAKNQF